MIGMDEPKGGHGSLVVPDAGRAESVTQVNAAVPSSHDAALTQKVADLERDNHAYREKLRATREAEEAAAKKRGELEPLLAEREKELEDLRKQFAEAGPLIEREKKRLAESEAAFAEKVKSLSPEDQRLVNAIADVDARDALLQRLTPAEMKPDEPSKVTPRTPRKVAVDTPQASDGPAKPFRIF